MLICHWGLKIPSRRPATMMDHQCIENLNTRFGPTKTHLKSCFTRRCRHFDHLSWLDTRLSNWVVEKQYSCNCCCCICGCRIWERLQTVIFVLAPPSTVPFMFMESVVMEQLATVHHDYDNWQMPPTINQAIWLPSTPAKTSAEHQMKL